MTHSSYTKSLKKNRKKSHTPPRICCTVSNNRKIGHGKMGSITYGCNNKELDQKEIARQKDVFSALNFDAHSLNISEIGDRGSRAERDFSPSTLSAEYKQRDHLLMEYCNAFALAASYWEPCGKLPAKQPTHALN